MIKLIFTLLLSFICTSILFAQAGKFISNASDSRSIAMGNNTITSSKANAFYTNPSSYALNNTSSELHSSYLPNLNFQSSDHVLTSYSGALKFDEAHLITAGIKTYKLPTYSTTDDEGNKKGSYTPEEKTWGLAYAYQFSDSSAFSFSINYLESKLYESYAAQTFYFNLSYSKLFKNFEYGITINNLGPKLKFANNSSQLPFKVEMGACYSKNKSKTHQLHTSVNTSYLNFNKTESGFAGSIGAEYEYNSIIALRTGYYKVSQNIGISNFSLGTGIRIKKIHLDFAYLLSESFSDKSFGFSVSWCLN